MIEGQIGRIYTEFKDRVAAGAQDGALRPRRHRRRKGMDGTEALDLGLVDETGGFREALRKARELGGIERTYRV